MKGGLLPKPENKNAIQLGALVANLPDPKTIPDFSLDGELRGRWAEEGSQQEDDCSAWAVIAAMELYWGVRFSRKFQFAMSKARSGDPEEWGQNLDDAMMTPVKIGALPVEHESENIKDAPLSFTRYLTNWGNIEPLVDFASQYRMKGMTEVTGPYDAFDNAIATMWYFAQKGEKRAVVFGTEVDFGPFNEVVEGPLTGGFGHAMNAEGRETRGIALGYTADKQYIRIQGSWDGTDQHLFDRTRFNESAKKYGIYVFVPYTAEDMKWMVENKLKYGEKNLAIRSLIHSMYAFIADMLKLISGKSEVGAVPSPFLLPALIWQESTGIDSAIGDNGNAFGPLQIWQSYMSDVYKFRTARECLNNRALSIDVYKKYMARYATDKRLGRPVTDQDIARMHNGGPSGWKKDATLPYWWAVKKKMELLQSGKVEPKLLERITKLS